MNDIPDFCPDFNFDLESKLKGIPTRDILEYLGRNRFPLGSIISAIEKKDPRNISVKTFLKGQNAELEILNQDISHKVNMRLSGEEGQI